MNFTEIKESVIQQLSKLTVDDFCAKPEITSSIAINIVPDFQSFLENNYVLNPGAQKKTFDAQLSIIKNKGKQIEKELEPLESKNKELNTILETNIKDIDILKIKEKELNLELKELKDDMSLKMAKFTHMSVDQQKKLAIQEIDLSFGLKQIFKEIQEKQTLVDVIKIQEKNNQLLIHEKLEEFHGLELTTSNKIKDLESKISFFEDEYASMEFLSKILLRKEVEISYQNELELSDFDFKDFYNLLLPYLQEQKNIIPKQWRNEISTILSNSIPCFAGYRVTHEGEFKNKVSLSLPTLERQKVNFDNIDFATLLSLKSGIKTNASIKTEDGRIILGLSGGLLATLHFREKTQGMSNYQEKPIEIYTDCTFIKLNNRDKYKPFEVSWIYSGISVQIPLGYYILSEKYIIYISFSTTPLLFYSNMPLIQAEKTLENRLKEEEEYERLMDDD